ncbi:MAG: GNAT family N-acetyltransferase [Butyrivibrio sp.]|nr:GNAT family N-acetyltransferase [Butyrivibrio sp.]
MATVRNAKIEDATRLVEIYDYYVKNTAITFEWETPSVSEFEGRMKNTMKFYPYLVIEDEGRVLGYAYAGAFKGRRAYDWACEMTIYLDHDAKKKGLGRQLYEALESALKNMGIINLYACIGAPEIPDEYLTNNSIEFHSHLGYELVGTFHKCGYKFNRWYNMVWMEKVVGKYKENAIDVKPYIN